MVANGNPLSRRFPRELIHSLPKYLVIWLLFTLTISIGSGMIVGGNSLMKAWEDAFTLYNIEDGYFETGTPLDRGAVYGIQRDEKITLYENFYYDETLLDGDTVRIFSNRDQVDKVCVMSGRLPKAQDEIALDRMYADNNKIHIGDSIRAQKRSYVVTGLVALSDYSSLFRDNSETMFDALTFGVAVMDRQSWNRDFKGSGMICRYSWVYEDRPADDSEASDRADDLMETIYTYAPSLSEFVPQYANQAIQFTGEDFQSDTAGTQVFIYILIIILAFVFGISEADTVEKEAAQIGTLRALGFTIPELIRHYLTVPIAVTLCGALSGNILAYTIMKDVMVAMYYNSYSLPTYHTVWNADAFLSTTLLPILLMLIVNFVILAVKLRLPPLDFLHGELGSKRHRKALRLPHRLSLSFRFGIRILRQNRSGYLLLLIGVLLSDFIALFGIVMPQILNDYESSIANQLLADHTYILNVPPAVQSGNKTASMEYVRSVKTYAPDAEKFVFYPLMTTTGHKEEVDVYGIVPNSRYIDINFSDLSSCRLKPQKQKTGADGAISDMKKKAADSVVSGNPETAASSPHSIWISSAYAEKCGLTVGDRITLREKYNTTDYIFTIEGIYPYEGALTVFMDQDECINLFDLDKDDDDKDDKNVADVKDDEDDLDMEEDILPDKETFTRKDLEDVLKSLEQNGYTELDDHDYRMFGLDPDDITDEDKEAINYLLKNKISDLSEFMDFKYFSGYFSDQGISDIKPEYIASGINLDSLTSVARQLTHSMGNFMGILTIGGMAVYIILMYLLTRLMIEKNARSISLTKILGYTSAEISRLYLLPLFVLIVIFQIICIPTDSILLKKVWNLMVSMEMSGWLGYSVHQETLIELGIGGILLFLLIAVTEYNRIRRIPMEEALKTR